MSDASDPGVQPTEPEVLVPPFEAVDPLVGGDEGARSPIPDGVALALAGVELSPDGLQPATGTVSLVDVADGRRIDIVMGRTDAALVEEAIAGITSPRPRPHDLLLAAVDALDGTVETVSIVERRPGGVYVASIGVRRGDGAVVALDARPSDALNVALRAPSASLWAASALLGVPGN